MADTLRQHLERRRSALELERQSWISHWRDISDYTMPRRGRFLVSDRNKGDRRNTKIIDNTGRYSLRTLAAGMMTGLTSPSRPWFRLTTPDPALDEFAPVKTWLYLVEQRMRAVFAKSNIYNVLHGTYEELGAFGTSAFLGLDDFEDVVRFYPFTAGEYMIAQDNRGKVDTIYREYSMTVAQVVGEFGEDNVSATVRAMHARGSLDQWVTVCHAIEPRPESQRERGKVDGRNKPIRSVYWEKGGDQDKVLREAGYDKFPGLAPRWDVLFGDIYGRSPAMDALGDIKQLQAEQKYKGKGIAKMVDPPMVGPSSLKNRPASVLPGDITYVDVQQGQQGFVPAYQVQPRLNELMMDIQEVQDRVRQAFYADLFLMLANSDRRQMTATEVAERHEEKLLALGPVLERLQDELLEPLIDRTFEKMVAAEILPPPPEELAGVDLRVEYISMLAQAQKAVATGGIERLSSYVGNVAAVRPDVLDKVNWDQTVDEYADALGVPPTLIVPDEQVAEIRAQRQKAEQAQQQAAMLQQAAQGAETLSKADMGGDSVLAAITGGMA